MTFSIQIQLFTARSEAKFIFIFEISVSGHHIKDDENKQT